MPDVVIAITCFWGILLVVIGGIAMAICIASDKDDSFWISMGIFFSGGFLVLIVLTINLLNAIFTSIVGVG